MTTTLQNRLFVVETRRGMRQVESTLSDAEAVSIIGRIEGSFSQDLVRQWARTGRFSPKQLAWVHLLAQEQLDKEGRSAPEIEAVVQEQEQMDRILELLTRAAAKLQYPRIRLLDSKGRLYHLTLAGERSKHPGSVNVILADGRVWLGRISTDGIWFPGKEARNYPEVVEALATFAQDPAGVAKGYGGLTGQCCFCGLGLTDERSVKAGFGPVCASHYGLADVWAKAAQK